MNYPPLEPQLEAEAEALLDDVFARLESPLPPRCLPPATQAQPLVLPQPIAEPGAMVVLAYNPAPVVPAAQPPYTPETILTAAFVDTPAERSTPWWLWLGLGVIIMLGTWQWRRQWPTTSTPVVPDTPHQEFIAYLEQSLEKIPERPTPTPTSQPQPSPSSVAPLPPPPPVTVMPIPQAPVIAAPVSLPPTPTALAPASKPTPRPVATLIGLLQMGENSVAMFQVGEVTQQVNVGGQVGQSGWQVKEVREREVVLARGGQNRTLIVGQDITD